MNKKTIIIFILILLTILLILNLNYYQNNTNKIPNQPEIIEGMIPVIYNEEDGNWIKADQSNSNNSWYNYQEKKWANIVLIKNLETRNYYINAKIGTKLEIDDISAFYVWIPRYKYRVFNINKQQNYDFYNAKEKGIEIIFEKGVSTTGNIKCNYYYSKRLFNNNNEICTGSNGQWYTHPAFTFDNIELKGIWVGKFEVTGSDTEPTILPSITALRNKNVSNQFKIAKQFGDDKYLLNQNTDAHMMKNMEWGVVAYLTHSQYGICDNNDCKEIKTNNSDSFITGNIEIDNITYEYNSKLGIKLSTTGNITGIYDISGGSAEYVMANISLAKGLYILNQTIYSGFDENWLNKNNLKYLDTYAYNNTIYGNKTSEITKLGDAMGETTGWYSDSKWAANKESSWIERGGNYSMGKTAGIFAYGGNLGYNIRMNGFRSVLIK